MHRSKWDPSTQYVSTPPAVPLIALSRCCPPLRIAFLSLLLPHVIKPCAAALRRWQAERNWKGEQPALLKFAKKIQASGRSQEVSTSTSTVDACSNGRIVRMYLYNSYGCT